MMQIPTKPSDAIWTDEQWKAIWAKGCDILVSAAAGSGKTAVLIERLIQKIMASGADHVDVDELLVVTFTNASAAEMRNRMAEALEKAIAADPQNLELRRQLSLLSKAQISTLHSFCLTVCREFAYRIDLDPGFRLASTDETALLQDDVLIDVLEKAYAGKYADEFSQEEMYRLVDSFSTDRSDQQIEKLLQQLYATSRVQPNPYEWLASLPQQYNLADEVTIDELVITPVLKGYIETSLLEAQAHLQKGLQIVTVNPALAKNTELFTSELNLVEGLLYQVTNATWQDMYELIHMATFERIKAATKKDPDDVRAQYAVAKAGRDAAKEIITNLQGSFFARKPALFVEEMRSTYPVIETLVKLTIAFSEAYKRLKLERGLLDFSDLEHYALEILKTPDSNASAPVASDVALNFKQRFKEVLVDEYQDTNRLQETILQLVKSGDEHNGNLFMVGDVKQSIYAFRLAEPQLFIDKYKRFEDNPSVTGLRIDLNANFRSRAEVLDGTNYIFEQIMDEAVGEIEYDEQAKLKYGASYAERDVPVELVLLEGDAKSQEVETEDGDVAEESISAAQQEARYIISQIEQMVQSGEQVYNPKTKSFRPISYRDIVVLMRSRAWYTTFAEEFKLAGLPLYAETDGGYFESLEVMIMLNTLKVVDNPYQDIPLASVLRAPFIGMTENELALIRLQERDKPFFDALQTYKKNGEDAQILEKIEKFFTWFKKWRDFSRHGSLADLIWHVYNDTLYFEMVGAMANGKQRQANLRALHDRALSYEKTSFRGLFRFLRFIDRMQTRGDDLGIAKSIGEADDVVTLLTIHKSKGLEYPVVFVAGMARRFNTMDLKSTYIFDQDFGLAIKAVNPDLNVISTSLPHLYVKERKLAKLRAEEMRILYVAMTRAKERLILVGSVKEWDKVKDEWSISQDIDGKMLPSYVRAKAMSYLQWVGPAVARHQDFHFIRKILDAVFNTKSWALTVISNSSYLQRQQVNIEELESVEQVVDEALVNELTARFTDHYTFKQAITKKSKTSVSELKRLESLQLMEEEQAYNSDARQYVKATKPSFMQKKKERKLSPTEIGTAVHAVMQHIPQVGFATVDETKAFIQSLVDRQLLHQLEADAVEAEAVWQFFQTDIGQRFSRATNVLREVAFTLSLKDTDGDAQIIQGVIDCLFEENGEWILLDYKTDKFDPRIREDEAKVVAKMTKAYKVQLDYYEEAIRKIKHLQVAERVLYLYSLGQSIDIAK